MITKQEISTAAEISLDHETIVNKFRLALSEHGVDEKIQAQIIYSVLIELESKSINRELNEKAKHERKDKVIAEALIAIYKQLKLKEESDRMKGVEPEKTLITKFYDSLPIPRDDVHGDFIPYIYQLLFFTS